MIAELLNTLLRGVQTGSIYGLVAVGLNFTIASTGIFNFAHGEFVMVGAVLGALLWTSFEVPIVLAAVIALAAAGLIGGMTEVVAVKPLRRDAPRTGVVSTLGIALLVAAVFAEALVREGGSDTRPFPPFLPGQGTYDLGGVLIVPSRLLPVAVLIVALVALRLFTRRTNTGRALEAVASDPEGAAMRGVPVGALRTFAFVIGAVLAAGAGFAAGPLTQASVSVGLPLTIKGFVAAALGGMPRLEGAVAGGLVLGTLEQFTSQYGDTSLQSPIVLGALVLMLYLRPQGLLGRSYRTV